MTPETPLSRYLKAELRAQGMTRYALARLTDMSYQGIVEIVSGERTPHRKTLLRIANVLGKNYEMLEKLVDYEEHYAAKKRRARIRLIMSRSEH